MQHFATQHWTSQHWSTQHFNLGIAVSFPVAGEDPPSVSGTKKPVLQLVQPLHEKEFRVIIDIEEEDEELLSIVALLISSGIIK